MEETQGKVLIVYYSLTGRSREIAETLKTDLEEKGKQVSVAALEPDPPIVPPVKFLMTLVLTAYAGFKMERKVNPLPPAVYEGRYDLVILAGPSWGFDATPPMAYFAKYLLPGIDISPGACAAVVITCRRYWRRHLRNLRRLLERSGLEVVEHLALEHQGREPFRFLVLKAELAEEDLPLRRILGRFYPPFGFSQEQVEELHGLASRIADGRGGGGEGAETGKERPLLKNLTYVIPLREKMAIFLRRVVIIPYLTRRYVLRRFIETDMKNPVAQR